MKRVDLVVPGLLNLPEHEINRQELIETTPWLHRLLRFSSQKINTRHDIDDILIHILGLNQEVLPYAQAMNDAQDRDQVLFKPVYLKSDINNAIVYPVDDYQGDIPLLINELHNYFKVDCSLTELSENIWLMSLHSCQPLKDTPHYLTATGKKVTHYLQQAKTNLDWFKLFNEMQMFLYQHEINQQRIHAGRPMVNSLWCWGADPYRGERVENTRWISDDALMQGIGKLYTGQALPMSHIRDHRSDLDDIIIDLSILKALKGDWNRDVMQLLKKLESDCLKPIVKAGSSEIYLHTGGDINFHFKPWMTWKLWKQKDKSLVN